MKPSHLISLQKKYSWLTMGAVETKFAFLISSYTFYLSKNVSLSKTKHAKNTNAI
jgi:hypothetical protein